MQLKDLVYLNDLLGSAEVKRYIDAPKDDINLLIKLLRLTNVVNILDYDKLVEFCRGIVFGKYKKVFVECLYEMNDLTKKSNAVCKYSKIIDRFIDKVNEDENEYIEIFDDLRMLAINNRISIDWKMIEALMLEEIEEVRLESKKVSIKTFLDNGGTVSELILMLANSKKNMDDFYLDTKIEIPVFELFDCEYEVEIFQIVFLVSLLGNLNFSKEVEKELLETYYDSLEVGKNSGFRETKLIVRGRPNLYSYLKENDMIVRSSQVKRKSKDLKK